MNENREQEIRFSGDAALPIHTTRPEKLIRHDISDEELDTLCEASSDYMTEILAGAAGVLLGSAPIAIARIVAYFSANVEMDIGLLEQIQTTFFWVSIAVVFLMAFFVVRRTGRSKRLRQTIRERTQVQAQG